MANFRDSIWEFEMTQDKAEKHARTHWKNVASVTCYTQAAWRDGGYRGFRVMTGEGQHWMSRRGFKDCGSGCRDGNGKRVCT